MRKFVGFLLLIVVIGCLIFFLVPFSDDRYLNNRIKLLEPQLNGQISAIHLIKEATVCCRPCPKYEQLKKEEVRVLFVFYSDFSDNDISNFRVAFSVPDNTETRTMSPQWEKAYKRMNHRNDDKEYSYLIKLSNKATIENIWRF